MKMTLGEIAQRIGGKLTGSAEIEITGAAILREATDREVTLADNAKLINQVRQSPAAAVIVAADFPEIDRPTIQVEDVHQAFADLVSHFNPPREHVRRGISPHAHISPTAKIGQRVDIHPGAVIGDDVEIGDGCVIHAHCCVLDGSRLGEDVTMFPHSVLYENTLVGPRTVIHASAVVGAYGFGFQLVDGRHQRSAQLGHVEIGADVEIGAGCTIDRGTYGPTRVGEGTKLDNQVQIAHNVDMGPHNLACAQVGIAGSSTTGSHSAFGGQVGVADHINVGNRVVIGGMSGVMNNVPDGETWVGLPAGQEKTEFQLLVMIRRLPEMRKQLKALQRQVAELTEQLKEEEDTPPCSDAA